VSALTTAFIQLLVRKAREINLPEIVNAYIDQFNKFRNIYKVKITTAEPVTEEMKEAIMANVRATVTTNQTFEIELQVKE